MCDLVSSGKFAAVRKLDTEGFVRLVELVTQRWDAVSDFSFWSHRMPSDWRCLVEPGGGSPRGDGPGWGVRVAAWLQLDSCSGGFGCLPRRLLDVDGGQGALLVRGIQTPPAFSIHLRLAQGCLHEPLGLPELRGFPSESIAALRVRFAYTPTEQFMNHKNPCSLGWVYG